MTQETSRCRDLHRIYAGAKASHTPLKYLIRAFEYDEAKALRMYIEGDYPLLVALIGHAVEAFWFATTGRSRPSSQRSFCAAMRTSLAFGVLAWSPALNATRRFSTSLLTDCRMPAKSSPMGDTENFLIRECGLKRRQPTPFFISGDLCAGLAAQKISNLALGKAGSLAICPEIVFESWSYHRGIEIADQCNCLPIRYR
jgi:hypothetical protein